MDGAFAPATATTWPPAEGLAMPAQGTSQAAASSTDNAPIGACDTCRIRRVKCNRIDNDPVCEGCRKRDLNCTRLRFGIGKYKLREGRRIAAAVATFGRANQEEALSAAPYGEHAGPPGGSRVVVVADALNRFAGPLSESSTEAFLGRSEDSAALVASLLDTYIASSNMCLPVFRYQALQKQFDRAGRRLKQLPLFNEMLALGAVCFGAYISDHPLLVGNDAPSMYQVRRLGFSTSLGQYARRRISTTSKLLNDFISMVDRRACFRVASIESMAVLALAADAISHLQGKRSLEIARPYWAACCSHARQLADEGRPTGNELDNRPEILLSINDSFRSSFTGQRLIVGDDDLEIHFPDISLEPPSLADLPNALFSGDSQVYGRLSISWVLNVIHLNRSLAKAISIPFAKDLPIPLARFEEAIARASSLLHLSLDFRTTTKSYPAGTLAELRKDQRVVSGTSLVDTIDSMPVTLAVHFMVIHRKFRQWRQRLETFQEIGLRDHPTLPAVEDQRAIQAVAVTLDEAMVEVFVLMSSAIEEMREDATDLFCHHSMLAAARWHLKWFALTALSIKCAENGGPSTFPLKRQLEIVQIFIEALRVQSWTWANMQDDAEAVDSALRKYRAAIMARRSSSSAAALKAAASTSSKRKASAPAPPSPQPPPAMPSMPAPAQYAAPPFDPSRQAIIPQPPYNSFERTHSDPGPVATTSYVDHAPYQTYERSPPLVASTTTSLSGSPEMHRSPAVPLHYPASAYSYHHQQPPVPPQEYPPSDWQQAQWANHPDRATHPHQMPPPGDWQQAFAAFLSQPGHQTAQ